MASLPPIVIPITGVLGSSHLVYPNKCWLCDEPILYKAIYIIRAFDEDTNKNVSSSMEIPVCEKHAQGISFEVVKQLKSNVRQLIVIKSP